MIGTGFLRGWLLLLAGMLSCRLAAQPLPELIPYKAATGWGYSDSNKVIKVPCIYRSASLFYNGKGRVTMARDSEVVHCLLDRNGKYLIGPELNWIGKMNNYSSFGMLNAHDAGGRWGGIDTAGKLIIPFLYDSPGSVGRRSFVQTDENIGSWHGPSIPGYYRSGKASSYFFVASRAGKWGMVDTNGALLIPFDFDEIKPAQKNQGYDSVEGWLVRRGGKWGMRSVQGGELVPCRYDEIHVPYYQEKRSGAAVRTADCWGWYNVEKGTELLPDFRAPPEGAGPYVNAYDTTTHQHLLIHPTGKLFSGEQYWTFELYPDSVIAVGYEREWFRSGQLHLPSGEVTDWRSRPDYLRASIGPARYFTGDRPALRYREHWLQRFEKNRRAWWISAVIQPRLGDEIMARTGDLLGVASDTAGGLPALYAIIDTGLNFVFGPQPEFEFLGGDVSRGYLIVRPVAAQTPVCGVTDLHFNWIVPPQKKLLGAYFQWKGKKYLVGAFEEGVPVFQAYENEVSEAHRFGYGEDTLRSWFRKRNPPMTVLNAEGSVLKGFDSCRNPLFFSRSNGPSTAPEVDIIAVRERFDWALGFVRLNGQIAYPALHFKYREIDFLGPEVAVAYGFGQDCHLLNRSGKELAPTIDGRIRNAYGGERVFEEYHPLGFQLAGIMCLIYIPPGTDDKQKSKLVYADRNGTLYADADAL